MKRVMIIGQPGSGKSTLARELGARTGLPVFHIDREVYWMSGWQERDMDEKLARVAAIHAQDEWVFEGNFSRTFDDRTARADTFIFLDLPLWLRAWRVAKRTIGSYGRARPDMAEGCPEQVSLEFYAWIWRTRHTGRQKGLQILADPPPHLTVHHLTSPRAVRDFLTSLDLRTLTA